MQDKIFYAVCFGFGFGVFLRSLVVVNFYFIILLIILAFVLFLFFTFLAKNKWGIIATVFILAFSLGVFRFQMVDQPAPVVFSARSGPGSGWESGKMHLSGTVVDEPDIRENSQKLTVELSRSNLDSKAEKTKILVTTNLGGYFKYGDEINFSGKLQEPENFITDQGKEFDYVNYLRKDGIFYVMNYGDIEILSRGHGNKIKSVLFSIKNKFLEKMNFAIRAPESLLMGGLILGEKASFSQDMRQKFIDTGTIHIVALSGYNITIVAEWFMELFKSFPKNLGISMGILSIFLFVLMTGGSSTAIRAGIMATLALVARATSRTYDIARALILAGVIMILVNPYVLVFDVSFQLSFIATVAIIFLSPKLEKYFLWVTKSFGLREIFSATTAAYIFVLPFILYKMGNLSLVALPANILILPFIPFTMGLGFVTGVASMIYHLLGVPLGFISYLFLHYELSIINFFAHFSFSAFSIPNFPFWLTILIYMYFIYMLFGRSIKSFFQSDFIAPL